MLFNSYPFFLFFVIVALGYFKAFRSFPLHVRLYWFILASLFFYSQWELWHLVVLLGSIILNYTLSIAPSKPKLIIAITLNLGLLGYFKYLAFFASWVGLHVIDTALPLGISFFTFQQIAYQIDRYRAIIPQGSWRDYLLFVTFFPQLIAGPIVHYRELIPQFYISNTPYITHGLTFFIIGLFKKVVLADTLAPFSDTAFSSAATQALATLQAWLGILAYTLQIYFDFSGYADMAIGLGLMLGIWLPLNFNSPYKALNIREFWRRWHITLSHFLRDYLYIPLGGSHQGRYRHAFALCTTMLLGGLWHGAGWGFLLWGGAHGAWLVASHFSRHVHLPKPLHVSLTFCGVALLWVLFRAPELSVALHYYKALFSFTHGYTWVWHDALVYLALLSGLCVVWFLPSTQSWTGYATKALRPLGFKSGILLGMMLALSLKALWGTPPQSFVYFVF